MRYLTLLVGLLSLSLALASQTQTSTNPSQTPSTKENEPRGGDAGTPGIYVQEKIQKAIQQDSSLSGANVNVSVNDNKVELSGTVANKDQKKTVRQIADSNAGGMKVVDHVKVEGKGNSPSTPEMPKN